MMDKWYSFNNVEDFNLWHEALKVKLGYPLPSIDEYGNILGEPYSTNYTSVVKVADNDYRAVIKEQYAEGLILSEKPIFTDEPMSI